MEKMRVLRVVDAGEIGGLTGELFIIENGLYCDIEDLIDELSAPHLVRFTYKTVRYPECTFSQQMLIRDEMDSIRWLSVFNSFYEKH